MINCFVLRKQPKSHNSWQKESEKGKNYIKLIRDSCSRFNRKFVKKTEDLYGIAYYFYSVNTEADADNISKPIWDSLSEFLFDDDKQVKLRIAGTFDLRNKDFKLLDVTGVPGKIVAELIDSVACENHTIYVECGSLKDEMYKFNIE